MKSIKILILLAACTIFASSCKKVNRFPEVENSANAQFIRDLGVTTTAASFNKATLNKANPTLVDKFTLKIVESGNVASVNVVVDYKKGSATLTQPFRMLTSWPISTGVSLNDLIALFAGQGVTAATVASGDSFVFRTVFTLNDGTIISEQAAVLLTLPYATTLTYNVAN